MKRYFLASSLLVFGSLAAHAATITFNFGDGSNIDGSYPGHTAAGASTNGVALTNPLLLDVGELQITSSGGALDCDQGANANTCGYTAALTTADAYGLGVGGGRLSGDDTITLSLTDPGYTVSIVSFSLTGFTNTEVATYQIDSGSVTNVNPLGTAFETYTLNQSFTNSVTFGVGNGNYSLAQIVLDVTPNATPEPGTIGLVGLALAGAGLISRKRFSKQV